MHPKVKICGLTRPEDIETAIVYGVGALGFIVEAKSKRRLSVGAAARLARPASGIIPTIAVTVNPDDALIYQITSQMQPDYIQLHGDETPSRVRDIRKRTSVKLIKALPVSAAKDIAAVFAYDADMILLDAKPPKGEARGGHGKSFDWNILKDTPMPEDWILAGGLNAKNIARAAALTQAPILDISSGAESTSGVKDAAQIKAIMKAVSALS